MQVGLQNDKCPLGQVVQQLHPTGICILNFHLHHSLETSLNNFCLLSSPKGIEQKEEISPKKTFLDESIQSQRHQPLFWCNSLKQTQLLKSRPVYIPKIMTDPQSKIHLPDLNAFPSHPSPPHIQSEIQLLSEAQAIPIRQQTTHLVAPSK